MDALERNDNWKLVPLPPEVKPVGSKSDGQCIILSIYVDDIIIIGDDALGIIAVKQALEKSFDIKDLGLLRYFLGIEIARSRHGIRLSQRKYTLNLLQDMGMMGCRPTSTHMDQNLKLSTESGELLPDASVHQRLVGRLIYLTNTRPYITFVASVVSQFMHTPRTSHLDAVHHILRYLKTCPGLGLFYTAKAQDRVSCFTDADYAWSKSDRRSTLDYVHFMAATFCRGRVRSRLLFLVLRMKQNIEPWLRVHVNSFGSARS
ncbi:uncharacterized mitochondrial protein AtMg00810-like [Actinidia eriantha]|uniref:uncharacterized mitochondrial protein AtMg00810-like n=1 Tax=Actinidia eriantha TaxID=165200 RepID=UPI0025910EAB|nr:uncharacterized mitochondrial protein AtMg00810-like [Actinidia eriantha]